MYVTIAAAGQSLSGVHAALHHLGAWRLQRRALHLRWRAGLSTHVLATLGIRNAFELGDPRMGMATVLTALPLLIPLVILLMRQLRRNQVTI